ncbi:MAG: hypothetical protein HY885_01220 [Deltaproteobacteria bacterium]|nr:hypothetical protein [Deltaproteobacteria bacterium]
MKSTCTLVLSFIILAFAFAAPAAAEKNPWDTPLPFKEATIQYTISGTENGTETLYIKDHGKERARHRKSTAKVMSVTNSTDEIEITSPDWIYHLDMTAKTGTKVTNPLKFMMEEYDQLSAKEKEMVNKNAAEMGASAMKGMQGGIKQNAEKFMGYDCDVTTMSGTTVHAIHATDITLKAQFNMMGMNFSTVATNIDTSSPPGKAFTLPAGVQISHDKEADDMARSMTKSTIDTLKSPDGAKKMKEMAPTPPRQGGYPGAGQPGPDGQMDEASQQEMEKAMKAMQEMFGK